MIIAAGNPGIGRYPSDAATMASTARNASHEAYHPVVQTFIAAMRAVSEMSYDGMCGPHAEHAARRAARAENWAVSVAASFSQDPPRGATALSRPREHTSQTGTKHARVASESFENRQSVDPKPRAFARAREEGARALASPRLVVAVRGLEVRLEGSQGDGPVFAAHTPDVAVRAREDGRDRDERRRAVKPHGPLR